MRELRISICDLRFVLASAVLLGVSLMLIAAPTKDSPSVTPAAGVSGRFVNVDVFVDPHGNSLAAYQIECTADPKRVTLVGVEGGFHAAFKNPPYYDPQALAGHRIVLAALNPGSDLPKEKVRVATLHLRTLGDGPANISAKLVTAASSNDQVIAADVSVSEGANP
jgi:hypothetical protein